MNNPRRPVLSLRAKLLNNGNVRPTAKEVDLDKTATRVPPTLSRLNEVLRRRALTSHI
jgi:hypothetical protein